MQNLFRQPTGFSKSLLLLLLLPLLSACVVRTQDFHCVLDIDPTQNFELRMTPTALSFRAVNYNFKEERGTARLYENKLLRSQVEFNPVSNKLFLTESPAMIWSCQRYEAF